MMLVVASSNTVHTFDALCKALQLPGFKDTELMFLKEEHRVLAPLAECVDRLQSDTKPEELHGVSVSNYLSAASSVFQIGY